MLLRANTDLVTHIFSGVDGEIVLSGACYLPWHGIEFDAQQLQVIPKYFRQYPSEMDRLKQRALRVYKYARRVLKKLKSIR